MVVFGKLSPRLSARTLLGASLVAAALVACSSSNGGGSAAASQASARDQAVAEVCSRLTACNDIGAGKRYPSLDQCQVQQTTAWNQIWPVSDCDGKIDGAAFDTCLQTIRAAECGNAGDLANILLNKCPASKVCRAS